MALLPGGLSPRVSEGLARLSAQQPFRQAVANLTPDTAIELVPVNGESLRKLKLNLARAAKEVGRNISYGETNDSMIVACLADGEPGQKRRRARKSTGTA